MNFAILSEFHHQDVSLHDIYENTTKLQTTPEDEACLVPSVSKKGHPNHLLSYSYQGTFKLAPLPGAYITTKM